MRRRLLVAVTAACVALSGCGAVRVSVERAPSPTTDEGVPAPPSSPSPSSSGRVVVGAEARRALERVVEDHPEVAIALAPVGGDGTPVTVGADETLPAWSTIKVPLALAAHRAHPKDAAARADVEAAITVSDNEAAARLWTGLGEPAQARRAVERVLREAGDRTTRVQDRQVVAGYSPFGQTRWRVEDQALFLAGAACAPDAAVVTDPMGRLVGGHTWGLAGLDGAVAKGGWGPTADGYVLRQMGLLPGAKGGRLAVAVQLRTSDHATGTALMDEVAAVLAEHVADLPGGRCPP